VIFLTNLADEALDDEDKPMNDWEPCEDPNFGLATPDHIQFLSKWLKTPCIGRLAKWYLDMILSYSYDISVAFIEAHEEANKMIKGVVHNDDFAKIIIDESLIQINLAERYVTNNIEDTFPEISKSM